MNKIAKNNTKELFFKINEILVDNSAMRSELIDILRYASSLNSCCIEHENIPPHFIQFNQSYESLVGWEKHLLSLHNLYYEIENHQNMLILLEKNVQNKSPFDTSTIRDLHHTLYKRTRYNLGGQLRNNNHIDTQNGHLPSHHSMLPEQLEQHFLWLDNRLNLIGHTTHDNFFEIFHIAAETLYRLLESAPFTIGNGIISRMMSDYVFIKTIFFYNPINYYNRQDYYKAVNETTFSNIIPLSNFLLENFTNNIKSISHLLAVRRY